MNSIKIKSIRKITTEPQLRYDITVKDNHNFFVSGVLVHNCQNMIQHLPTIKDQETFEVTIKLDGSSMTVFHLNEKSEHFAFALEDIEKRKLRNMSFFDKMKYKVKRFFGLDVKLTNIQGVCSRNIQLDTNGSNHFSEYVRNNSIMGRLASLDENIAIQGELIGPSIQNNFEQVKDNEYYIYDVFNIDTQKYLLPAEARKVVISLGLKYVPVLVEDFNLNFMIKNTDNELGRELVDNILIYAEGPGMNKNVKREGIVFKSNTTEFSMKAISNSYLLKLKD